MIEIHGADAYFLWEESRARHMHTLKIAVVDPSTSNTKVSFERFQRGALALLPYFEAFRRRPVASPLGIGHPVWIDAPDLRANYHLRHEILPSGAGAEALDDLVSRIASEPLDRAHPLWQIFLVEGLPGGRIAYVTKLHHSVADGVAAAALVLRSFQTGPEPLKLPEPYAGHNESVQSGGRRLAAAMRRELMRQRELPGLVRRSLKAIGVSLRWKREGRPLPPRPFSSPSTRFNRAITPNRICTHTTLSLSQMRRVKQAFDCTINAVYISLVGGALRRYLAHRGELTDHTLTAAVPVSVRQPEDDPIFGNATAFWFTNTGCDVADPVERLRVVSHDTRASRAHFEARDVHLVVEWLNHWPLRRIHLDGLQVVVGGITRRPSYNVIISNVRGPAHPLYSDGARVEALYSMGPLTLQQGLNFTAWSYQEDFTVGLHACREHVPDLRWIADALSEELAALIERLEADPQIEASRGWTRSCE